MGERGSLPVIGRGSFGGSDRERPLEVARPYILAGEHKVKMKDKEGLGGLPKNPERLKDGPRVCECRDAWMRAGQHGRVASAT